MNLPSKEEAKELLYKHVKDSYQRHHAHMVGTAVEGYADLYGEDRRLWYITGLLHDIDFEEYPESHPAQSLKWFREWDYPEDLIHAVESHAYNYNGFTTLPKTKLAAALMACDEISGIFYAYQKMNPIPYGEMKSKSIKKKLKDKTFAAKIDREIIYMGCEKLEVEVGEHIENLVNFFQPIGISKI